MNCFETYGVADLAGRDPMDLRRAALLNEGTALADRITEWSGIPTDVGLSLDQQTVYIRLNAWGLPAAKAELVSSFNCGGYLTLQDAQQLHDTLRNVKGWAGVERFLLKERGKP